MSAVRLPLSLLLFLHIGLSAGQSVSGFVRVSGSTFVDRQCRPFVYSGWNSWDLLEAAAGVRSALPNDASHLSGNDYVGFKLDIAKDNGLTVGRIFAHGHSESVLTLQIAPGVYNEQALVALDRLLDAFGQRGLKLILTFADNWKEVDSRAAYARWAGLDRGSFYTDETIRTWYKNHISTIVNRENTVNQVVYKDDPTIFAWNLMNEPRCDCIIENFSDACEKPCADNLQAWIEEMSMFLKTEDPLHMVTVGEEGFYGLESGRESENPDQVSSALFGGLQQEEFLRIYNLTTDMANWATRSGQDFVRNHDMESIDYCAVHLWPDNWGGLPIAFQSRWIEAHAIDSAALGKPMTIEEFGKISGASDQEIKDVRDPYIRDVCNTFDQLKTTYPLGGIAFWEFDAKYLDRPDAYTIYPTHSTFEEIIVPASQKINEETAALPLVQNCMPGDVRSFDVVFVEGTAYVTAGVNLLAKDQGSDISDELVTESIASCLQQCERSATCNSVSYNKNRGSCFLKQRSMETLDVEVGWSVDGWQSFWKPGADTP